jgi:hypothetical protein
MRLRQNYPTGRSLVSFKSFGGRQLHSVMSPKNSRKMDTLQIILFITAIIVVQAIK